MGRKTVATGAVLAALSPLGLTATAQAAPSGLAWMRNASRVENEQEIPTIAWGTLTFESAAQTVTCKVAEVGNIVNLQKEEHFTADAETVKFLPYQCASSAGACVVEMRVHPAPQDAVEQLGYDGMPWPGITEGTEATGLREIHENVKLTLECPAHISAGSYVQTTEESFTGSQAMRWESGTSGAKPSELAMRSSSMSGLTIKGSMKIVSFEGSPVQMIGLQEEGES